MVCLRAANPNPNPNPNPRAPTTLSSSRRVWKWGEESVSPAYFHIQLGELRVYFEGLLFQRMSGEPLLSRGQQQQDIRENSLHNVQSN